MLKIKIFYKMVMLFYIKVIKIIIDLYGLAHNGAGAG